MSPDPYRCAARRGCPRFDLAGPGWISSRQVRKKARFERVSANTSRTWSTAPSRRFAFSRRWSSCPSRTRVSTSIPIRVWPIEATASQARRSPGFGKSTSVRQRTEGWTDRWRMVSTAAWATSRLGEPSGQARAVSDMPNTRKRRVRNRTPGFANAPRSSRLMVSLDTPIARPTSAWLRPAVTRASRASRASSSSMRRHSRVARSVRCSQVATAGSVATATYPGLTCPRGCRGRAAVTDGERISSPSRLMCTPDQLEAEDGRSAGWHRPQAPPRGANRHGLHA